MKIRHLLYTALAAIALLAACAPTHEDARRVDTLPNMFPNYADVTIPVNMAPLNFLLRYSNISSVEVVATIQDGSSVPDADKDNSLSVATRGNTIKFDMDEWKNFMQKAVGKKVNVQVYALGDNEEWTAYKPFTWEVVGDSIDPYLTYQLIEPDYKVWNGIQIKQRCLENFREKLLADPNLQDNRCMNCHIQGNQDPNLSMIYLSEDGRIAILNRNGKLRKLDIENKQTISPSVYYGFSPSGRYITFSSNLYEPAFHAVSNQRIEVYDTKSDVYVADLDNNVILSSPLTTSPEALETFPTFSPNGKYIYYCVADSKGIRTHNLKEVKYALVRIPFDEENGRFGHQVDTLYTARSVCHPKISPDGRYCLFTVADYGTCPSWHPESNLCMIDLQTGKIDSLNSVNSSRSDSYHSWSHNSRWFVFGSKRVEGIYTRPFFCYVDRQGKVHKPFMLPQKDPRVYDECLKCFNIPELSQGPAPFDAISLDKLRKEPAEHFK